MEQSANTRLQQALRLIDEANRGDPVSDYVDGVAYPRTWLYGMRMSERLKRMAPEASEALQIAARAQHIRRWEVPRTDYPDTREGYLRWRSFLYRFHADHAEQILVAVGYDRTTIDRVRTVLLKQGLKRDPDVQLIEDVACLVFLEHYFPAFAEEHDDAKLTGIVRKTWAKMSEAGHQHALSLTLPERLKAVVSRALRMETAG